MLENGLEIVSLGHEETAYLYHEIFVAQEYDMRGFLDGLASGDVVLDVGANIGLFSVWITAKVPGCQVLAFEPVPKTFAALRLNLARHAPRVKAVQVALGASPSLSRKLLVFPQMPGNSTFFPLDKQRQEAEMRRSGDPRRSVLCDRLYGERVFMDVKVQTLSSAIDSCGSELFPLRASQSPIPRIALLKIDVEGAEAEVLEGVSTEQWPLIERVVMEVHDTGTRLQEVHDEMIKQGFHVWWRRPSSLAQAQNSSTGGAGPWSQPHAGPPPTTDAKLVSEQGHLASGGAMPNRDERNRGGLDNWMCFCRRLTTTPP